jgi:hypothetical protein
MNSIIDIIQEQYDSSEKSFKGKIMSGAKERATNQYFKDTAARARRKQNKVRYDTFRRDEQPTEEDLQLENIHFANFLGIKDSKYGVSYNNVNINECDILLPYENKETDSIDIIICSEDEAEYERNEEEQAELIAEQANFDKMVEYMREQVRIAELIAANELYFNKYTDILVDMSDEYYIADLLQCFCDVNDDYELTEQNYITLGFESPVPLPHNNIYKIWNIHFSLLVDFMAKNAPNKQTQPSLFYIDNLPDSIEKAAASKKYFTVYLLKFPVNGVLSSVLRFEYIGKDKPKAYYDAKIMLKDIIFNSYSHTLPHKI